MAGSYWKQGERYFVGWYYDEIRNGIKKRKQAKIGYYKGEKIYHEEIARKCLSQIQGRWEDSQQGLCHFRIEEFTGKGWTDVIEFYEKWLEEVIKPKRKPATIKGYGSYLKNWIKPFFEKKPVRMHEIQLDTLNKLLNSITLTGKGKLNVMMAFHSMMDYAWRSKRIPEMPPFPKKNDYNIVEPAINWRIEERQMAIINAIPDEHRPIFLWLKYHLRRPGEACALKWEDYDSINNIFIIRRSISARTLVVSTKTAVEHIIPCHSAFEPVIKQLRPSLGNFIFKNPRARKPGKRYY
jgi:integrase